MKQDNGKKSKKWLLIVIAIVALLAAAAVALVFILGGNNQGTQQGEEPTDQTPVSAVYWNLDKEQNVDPETGLSAREKGEDGLYTIRFASEGKIVEMKTADKQLVNYIDTMDAVGLVLDESGLIIDVLSVKDVALEKAKNFYVKRVDGNNITVNSSVAMNGMDITVVLTDAASIMDVRPGSETIGQSVQLEVFDMVSIYATKEEVVTSVFLHERPESSPLYMRVDRLYDSKTASTTRVPDKDGVYTIPFAVNGEVVQLKCKEKNVVTGIDSGTDSKQVMGLTFDEEGYITGTIVAATAARGKLLCQVYNVTAINGNQIEATRLMSGSEQGKVVNFTLTENTQIVMNEDGCNHFIGQMVDDLKHYDRVIVWGDMDNNALYIKIDRRKVEGDDIAMYYLKGKKYDSTNKVTTRVPDEKGYYVYELASKGKMVTVKTKNKDLASKMDGDSYQFFGLKVKGGIVQEFYNLACLSGGYGIGGQRFVTEVMANIVRIVNGNDFTSGGNYMLTDKTEIYNMTGYNGKLGSKTTLQVGDRVICARDVENNITHIYVLDRPVSGSTKMYYNVSRKYSSTTLETTRTPDAEGYYVFDMYCEGKQVQVKTKDKDIATIIDQQNAPIAALKVNSEGIVTAAYPAIAGQKYTSKVFNFNYVGEITKDKVVSCYYYSNGEKFDASKSYPMAKNCKVYNVSTNYSSYRGEKSSIKVGDQIQALVNIQTGELTHIWIMNRAINSPLYFHANRVAPVNGVTQRVPNEDGYYEVELFADGAVKTYRTKDIDIMSAVDTYGSETFFTLKLDGDIILGTGAATSSTRSPLQVVSNQDVMKISGSTITTERKRPAQSNTGATTEFKITSKTKIYDVCYYSENQFKAVKLQKGDRVVVYGDRDGNVNYVFVMYPHTREKGYQAKCSHCNKTVWWEPYLGSFIASDEVIHYYLPTDRTRSQGTMGKSDQTIRYNAVFDMNGCTLTSTGRNFLVYGDLTIIDSVGGGILEAKGYNGGSGGNFMVSGGSVTVNDGVIIRMSSDPEARSSQGGNFYVSNQTVGDKKYVGKITINDAKLEGWPNSSGNFKMNDGTVLNLNGGSVSGGNIELVGEAKFNWKNTVIDSNLTINGGVLPLEGTPAIGGMLLNSNGGKFDISKLSTDARLAVVPSGVFTTESDNIDAYLDVFAPAASTINIVKEGKALASSVNIPSVTEDLQFVPGTQLAVCPVCEQMVTWTALTQESNGATAFGTPGDGAHIYLAEDITYTDTTSQFFNAPSRDKETNTPYVACFHLNGHNWTGTNKQLVHGSYGILNVMGTGVVSGNNASGATVTINTNLATGYINLVSGTYTKPASNKSGVLQINANGGAIRVGKDATIVTDAGSLAISVGTSSLIPSNLAIAGTVKGGYITMADARADKGFTNTFLLMDGANVEGDIILSATNIIGLQGKVITKNLDLSSGAKIAVSELTEGAEVAVSANGIFTEAWENLEEQKGFYAPAKFHSAIEVKDGALSTTRDPNAPNLVIDPIVPEKPALLQVDNSNLVFEEGTTNAKCPVCGEVVEWIAITEAPETIELEGEKHYYLANDITYAGDANAISYQVYQQKVTCLHLNGHNITATAGRAIFSGGYLNVMGNGIVTGNSVAQHRGATVDVNSTAARLNLYGGTYVKDEANTVNPIVNVHGNAGGIINLYEGAIVDARNTTTIGVRAWSGEFNMYGGIVYGGSNSAVFGSNWANRENGTGTVNIFGGLIQAGTGSAFGAGGNATAPGHAGVYGGEIRGTVTYGANTELVLAGNPIVTRLNISGSKDGTYKGLVYLGVLTEGADITVNGDGVFTFQTENAEPSLKYFKGVSGKSVVYDNYALKVVAGGSTEPEQPEQPEIPADPKVPALPSKLTVDNSDLVFEAGTQKAKCPVCGEVKEWIAISSLETNLVLEGGKHYYLANDITYTGATANSNAIAFSYNAVYKGMPTCLHLNGKNLTATNGAAIFAGMELNVMGNGIVKGNRDQEATGATVTVNSGAAILNLYGGTYMKYDLANTRDLVRVSTAGGVLNIYQGVIIDGRDTVNGNSVAAYNGTVNVYGGEIYGGAKGHVLYMGNGTTNGNAVAGTANIFGGLIRAGMASGLGANGTAAKKAVLNVYGGEIRGGSAVKVNADVTIGGTAIMNRLVVNEGAKFTLAEMSEGASITVSANGIFTNPSANAATYVKYFHGLTGYKTPTVVDNALFTEEGTDEPQQPELPADPATPAKPALLSVDNANLTLEQGQAKCPVCNKTVAWTAITDTAAQQVLEAGKHYYLSGDLTTDLPATTDGYIKVAGETAACLHLNGHNITATATTAIFVTGKLNIMGNGTVSGAGMNDANENYSKFRAAALDIHNADAVVNVYGGTYAKPAGNTRDTIGVFYNGGTLNLFDGVTVNNEGQKAKGVRNFWGVMNIYGGTYVGGTESSGVFANNWSPSKSGTLNIFGGTFSGTKGSIGSGGADEAHSAVGIYGGTIAYMEVGKNCDVTVGGNPNLRLHIPEGRKFTLGQLTEGAIINVTAAKDGVFTNQSANAEAYTKFVKAMKAEKEVSVVDYALSLGDKTTEPEQPEQPEQPKKFDNSNLVFQDGNKAMCPACGQVVEWIAVTQEANATANIGEVKADAHYYLAEDITYTGTSTFVTGPSANKVLCFHLNGHNFTATAARPFLGWPGTFNIMGNGIVSGSYNKVDSGATVAINTNRATGVMNIYGGTYTKTATAVDSTIFAIQSNGGRMNIFEDVKIVTIDEKPAIFVGKAGASGAELRIEGATVIGKIVTTKPVANASGTTETAGNSIITVSNVELGVVELAEGVKFTIEGNTQIGKLEVAKDAKFTVGELGASAKIAVLGNGIVSEANTNMTAYFGCFVPYYGEVKVENNALVASHQTAIDNSDLVFEEGTQKAVCPYCKKSVEWTPITEIAGELILGPESHYYLANDINCSVPTQAIAYKYDSAYSRKITCLHLNGKNLTNDQGTAIFAGNYLNVMGNGIVSGNGVVADRGATIDVNSTVARLNLFGGTYVKATTNTSNSVVGIFTVGGVINLYDGATIDGSGVTTEKVPASVNLQGTKENASRKAVLNIYGGVIQNGVSTGNGGNIRIYNNGEINMYGGLITGGKAIATSGNGYGGNIYVYCVDAALNILGGTISNGEARMGGNIAAKSCPVTIKNATIIGGTTATNENGLHGGNISIDIGSVLTLEMGAVVANGTAKGQGGNIRCYQGNVVMNGGIVYGGTTLNAKAINHNIWVAGDDNGAASMTMNGGLVLGKETAAATGSAVHCSGTVTLTLDGNATVIDNSTFAGVRVPAGKLTTAATWTGSANVANA